jgi:integrase
MSQVFDRYEREALAQLRPSSAERARCIVNEARRWFVAGPLHDPHVGAITPAEIEVYLERKARTGVTPRTVNLHRAILHRVFRLCVRPWLLIPNNPVSAVEPRREEPRDPVMLTLPQYNALRASAERNRQLRLFVTLAWETGARRGELLQLEWADIDLERRSVTFANDPARGRNTKGRRSRTVPVSHAAVQALREHAAHYRLAMPKSLRVFVGRSGALNPRYEIGDT